MSSVNWWTSWERKENKKYNILKYNEIYCHKLIIILLNVTGYRVPEVVWELIDAKPDDVELITLCHTTHPIQYEVRELRLNQSLFSNLNVYSFPHLLHILTAVLMSLRKYSISWQTCNSTREKPITHCVVTWPLSQKATICKAHDKATLQEEKFHWNLNLLFGLCLIS